jgi:hypothetical protein
MDFSSHCAHLARASIIRCRPEETTTPSVHNPPSGNPWAVHFQQLWDIALTTRQHRGKDLQPGSLLNENLGSNLRGNQQ